MTDPHYAALVRDFQAEGYLVYMKDIDLDAEGNPVILVVTSNDHKPARQANHESGPLPTGQETNGRFTSYPINAQLRYGIAIH